MTELLDLCGLHGRVCPKPQKWDGLYKLLLKAGGSKPPMPLILAAWWATDDDQKRQRLRDQIHWAMDHGTIGGIQAFLESLDETEWHHEGE